VGPGVPDRRRVTAELQELRLLLRALADPGDAKLNVAVLVGLFFGLEYEQVTAHAVDRGRRRRIARHPYTFERSQGPVPGR
jgi:ATP-dependent exoDNAse (exonuclease V) beta subunit